MCRFLLVRSKEKIKPEKLINQFARMCEKSSAPDGDWQGDGWGIAIRNRKQRTENREQNWKVYKSLKPIWEEKDKFQELEETNMFAVHARSSGFPHHRGNLEYNQPYISGDLCFVFNGMIKGVKLTKPLKGKIGAQKIFSLIQNVILSERSESKDPHRISKALRVVDQLIINNSKKIHGMNIGIVKDSKFYILCEYDNNPMYFGIRFYQDDAITLVCSEEIGEYDWKVMHKSEVLVL